MIVCTSVEAVHSTHHDNVNKAIFGEVTIRLKPFTENGLLHFGSSTRQNRHPTGTARSTR